MSNPSGQPYKSLSRLSELVKILIKKKKKRDDSNRLHIWWEGVFNE